MLVFLEAAIVDGGGVLVVLTLRGPEEKERRLRRGSMLVVS